MSARRAGPARPAAQVPALVADAFTAAFLAAGAGTMLLTVRGQAVPPFPAFLWCLGLCAVLLLATRRRWLPPALAGLAAAVVALVATATASWPALLDAVGSLWRQGQSLLFRGQVDADWLVRLEPWLLLPVAAAATLFVRRWGSLLAASLAAFAALVAFLAWYPSETAPALLLSSGCLLLVPRAFVGRIHRSRPDEAPLDRAPLQLLAVPVVVACLGLAVLFVPSDTHDWRSPALLNQIGDWRLEGMGRLGLVRSWEAFGLDRIGFLPQGERLGGPVALSDTVFLTVDTDSPGLLKGSTRTVYTGSSWKDGTLRQYRYGSLRWGGVQATVFQSDLLGSRAGRKFVADYGRTVDSVVEVDNYADSTVFTTGRLRSLHGMDAFDPAYFTDPGDVFVFTPFGLLRSYRTGSLVLDPSLPGFTEAVEALRAGAGAADARRYEAVRQTCLQLPEELPATVAAAARTAVGDETEPYRQALALAAWFQKGFTYTLRPDAPPEGEDFVAHFLETKEGYCVYYASALAVMARTLGIPSRFVEGFALVPDVDRRGRWLATGHTAHAWVELYFEGVGWLPFDATPSVGDVGAPSPTPAPTSEASPGAASPSSSPEAPTPAPTPDVPGGTGAGWGTALLGLLGAAALLFLAGIALRVRHERRFDPAWIARRFPDPSARLEFLYRDLLAQLAFLDLRPRDGETLRQFAERAEAYLRLGGDPLPVVLSPVEALRYGGIAPSPEEAGRLAAVRRALEARLRESLPPAVQLVRRLKALSRSPRS